MEQNNRITTKWKMSILWTIIGFLTLILLLNHQTYQNQSFLAPLCQSSNLPTTTTTTAIMTSNLQQTPVLKPKADSSNIAVSDRTIADSTTSGEANDLVTKSVTVAEKVVPIIKTTTKKKCNIFEGKWIYDPKQSPSYNATRCNNIVAQSFRCQENGRPDSEYEKWRWEATDCHVPLFDGVDMLERLRNKKMVFVGDSINKNQWQSLACLLYSSVSDPSTIELRDGILIAKDYNFTLNFHWSSFLIELNKTHESGRKVLVLDKIDDISRKWRGADIIVFNTAHWWAHPDSIKAWDVFEYKGQLIEKMPRGLAFKRGMRTWAKWIKSNIDPKKTKIIFRSHSDAHYGKHQCSKTTRPIVDIETYQSDFPKPFTEVLNSLIKELSKWQLKYLDITKLSQYRSDAHTSVYTNAQWIKGSNLIDCSHWCLPGLPDTWNRLLYASLFFYDDLGDL